MKRTENVTRTYDHFYRYQEITEILEGYVRDYPELARLEAIGTTPQGRKIWVITVTDRSTGSPEDKPAFYGEGNIHAGEVTGCMALMYLLDVIFTNLSDPYIADMLKKYTIYICPRVSPDGSEHYLTTPDYVRSAPRSYPYEQPMPGLHPSDLDGDGVVRKMRIRSPYGIWKESPDDPRVMTRRLPDETEGVFYNVYSEGLIEEYDGVHLISSPGEFGNDFNRNYPVGWKPEHEQHGAGAFPLSNPETLANATFLRAHANVCAVLDMHTMGGQNLYTPGFKPSKEAEKADMQLYRQIGEMAKAENGYPLINVFDEYMPVGFQATYGGFDDFCHFILGVPAFTIECWDLDPRVGLKPVFPPKAEETWAEQEEAAAKYVQWIDKELSGEDHDHAIKPWTPFTHPQLGEVEIGGIDYKYVVQNPPIKFLVQELEKHTRFMLRYVHTLPQLFFHKIRVTDLGIANSSTVSSDLGIANSADTSSDPMAAEDTPQDQFSPAADHIYQLDVQVMNTGFMATYVFKEGLKMPSLKPLTLTLGKVPEKPDQSSPAAGDGEDGAPDPQDHGIPGVRLIQGKVKTDLGHLEGFSGLGGWNGGLGASTMEKDPCEKKLSYILAARPGTKLSLTVTGGRSGKLRGEIDLS